MKTATKSRRRSAVPIGEPIEVVATKSITFTIRTDEFRSLPLPGVNGGKLGIAHVRVTDLPEQWDDFMKVNPRVPSRTKKGLLSGPVPKGILTTLLEEPDQMVLKNQGLYLLVEDVTFRKLEGGKGELQIALRDPKSHGIVNGGHTYAAIRQAIEQAEGDDYKMLERAHVRLHLMQGIDESLVVEIAEGLNRSKQVDDPSLLNLAGHFERIKEVMKNHPGEVEIAYMQGDNGEIYIAEVLVFLEMFNKARFDNKKHPYRMRQRLHAGREFFQKDIDQKPSPMDLVIPHLPEILELRDKIRKSVPESAKRVGFEFGKMKLKSGKSQRAGTSKTPNVELPFIGKKMRHRVPAAWVYPMLAGFRANVEWNLKVGKFKWRMPMDELLDLVIDDLVGVCWSEHQDNPRQPEMVGRRESTYGQCYDKVVIALARSGKLNI